MRLRTKEPNEFAHVCVATDRTGAEAGGAGWMVKCRVFGCGVRVLL